MAYAIDAPFVRTPRFGPLARPDIFHSRPECRERAKVAKRIHKKKTSNRLIDRRIGRWEEDSTPIVWLPKSEKELLAVSCWHDEEQTFIHSRSVSRLVIS
jgi:hypothetical protein